METNESNGVLEFELHGLATREHGWRKEQCPEKKNILPTEISMLMS